MTFRAFIVERNEASTSTRVDELDLSALPPGEVLVRTTWSSVNYKDAMTTQPNNRVASISPLIPGIDLAGIVEDSSDPSFELGSEVIVHGYNLGVGHHGGFSEMARVPSNWVVPLPTGLTARQSMAIGTAGYTAFISLQRLESVGINPDGGPILVTGASGGLGSTAVALLASLGYEVIASSGKEDCYDFLRSLGATHLIGRDLGDTTDPKKSSSALGHQSWQGAIDCVGGRTLSQILRTLRHNGVVAASGLTGGTDITTTIYPFIIRNVSLLGVDSANTEIEKRRQIWTEISNRFPLEYLDKIVSEEIGLDDLEKTCNEVINAKIHGRILVRTTG